MYLGNVQTSNPMPDLMVSNIDCEVPLTQGKA